MGNDLRKGLIHAVDAFDVVGSLESRVFPGVAEIQRAGSKNSIELIRADCVALPEL
jgi:hypothetical protein